MICPDCNGKGVVVASHVLYADGSSGYDVPLQCSRCEGTGAVPDAMADWIKRGRAMRERRLTGPPYHSLREEAARRGLDAVTLSKMEMGRIEPKE